jgi:ribosomal protein L28
MPLPILTTKSFCAICGKQPVIGTNKPHSLHRTKKVVRPNLGQWQGISVCARCRKALAKPERVRKIQPVVEAVVVEPAK